MGASVPPVREPPAVQAAWPEILQPVAELIFFIPVAFIYGPGPDQLAGDGHQRVEAEIEAEVIFFWPFSMCPARVIGVESAVPALVVLVTAVARGPFAGDNVAG